MPVFALPCAPDAKSGADPGAASAGWYAGYWPDFVRLGAGRRSEQAEGYGLGLDSIRRIAASYSGSVTVEEKDGQFRIDILLRDI